MLFTYNEMKMELMKFRVPSIGAVVGKLHEVRAATVVCMAIAKAHPKDYKNRLTVLAENQGWLLSSALHEESSPISAILSHLIHENLFPVDDCWLEEGQMDYREDIVIHPGLYQYRMSYDEFSEMVSTDPDELSDYAGFPMMVCILGGWLDEDLDRFWKIYNKRFHWGIPEAPQLPGRDHYLSLIAFKRELQKREVSALYSMFLAIDGSAGNIFFDFDYELEMPPTLSLETLTYLHRQWIRSLPIARECDQAFDLITTDRQIYTKFLDAYQASLRKRKG